MSSTRMKRWTCCIPEWHGNGDWSKPIDDYEPDDAATRYAELSNSDDCRTGDIIVLVAEYDALVDCPTSFQKFVVNIEPIIRYRAREIE